MDNKLPLTFLAATMLVAACDTDFASYDDYPAYAGNDLGLTYTPEESTFTMWSPPARKVSVHFYQQGEGDNRIETVSMTRTDAAGVWQARVKKDLKGLFYTFQVETRSGVLDETPGIYARAVGVNGRRAAVINFSTTNPVGWGDDQPPVLGSVRNAIIYEMHVRDFTIHPSAGSAFPGKYLGLAESGTINPHGQTTGIDHLRELGVTHIQLLPVFDFLSVNESRLDSPQYNWGYDPQNYNVPEGSYVTDPYNPATRILEFKQMVQAFHRNGMRVVMDVVYNHTAVTEKSNFNLEVPGYYYRHAADGTYSDAAACGNETASERAMMRKYILASCRYWMTEYHIDGFRFDLMGIHDIEMMNQLSAELRTLDPTVLLYGEGWTAKSSPLPDSLRALKANTAKLDHFGAFSDDLRDGLKGSVFEETDKGFVNGGAGAEQSIRFGVVAATNHPQVDYSKVKYSKAPWARQPWQCINYVSCHDNHTLADKLLISGAGTFDQATLQKMDRLANGIVLTSQGIPFLHAGEEMMRTKQGVENSFNRPDSINAIDWNWKKTYAGLGSHYRALITLRKGHPVFRLLDTGEIVNNLSFLETPSGVVGYHLDGKNSEDSWSEVLVLANGNKTVTEVAVPEGTWAIGYDGSTEDGTANRKVTARARVEPLTLLVLYKN